MKYYGWMNLFAKSPSHRITPSMGPHTDTLARTRCGIYLNKRFLEQSLSNARHCKKCRLDSKLDLKAYIRNA